MSDDWGTMPGERDHDTDDLPDTCDECGTELGMGSEQVEDDEREWEGHLLISPKWLCHDCLERRYASIPAGGAELGQGG